MTKIYIKTDEVKNKVIPNLTNAINKLNSALSSAQSLKYSNSYFSNSYLSNVSSLINKEKEKCNKILKWANDSVSAYNRFNDENIPYIDKCLVEEIKTKVEKIELKY